MSTGWTQYKRKDGVRFYERSLGDGKVRRVYPEGSEVRTAGVTGDCRIGGTSAVLTPKSKSKGSSFTPVHRLSDSPEVEVRLSARVVEEIKSRVFWTTGLDQKEIGGWFQGVSTPDVIAVTDATSGTASDVKRDHDSMLLSNQEAGWLQLLHEWGDPHMRVGGWHSHPAAGSSGMPSGADLYSAEAAIELENRLGRWTPTWVSVIVTADENRWSEPFFSAWVTSFDGKTLTTKPGRLAFV